MDQTTLGRTGLRVSVAGLGCGGFSRLGMATGKTEAEAIGIVRLALESGITFIDTAANYGTEPVVGKAIAGLARDGFVLATKASIARRETLIPVPEIVASLENSLRALGTDHIDLFQLHGVTPEHYDYAMTEVVPALARARDAGKIRFLGITESGQGDPEHAMLQRATADGAFDVLMVAFNMLHRTAIDTLFPHTIEKNIGTLVMHAVRSIFARPDFLAASIRELAAAGRVAKSVGESPRPLDFLVHPGGAENLTDAAYRFARYTPGVSVVLFGTGSAEHLRANVASLSRPPLPAADVARLLADFADVSGLGLESPGRAA